MHIPVNAEMIYAAEESWDGGEEFFHNYSLPVNIDSPVKTAICGNIYRDYHEVSILMLSIWGFMQDFLKY